MRTLECATSPERVRNHPIPQHKVEVPHQDFRVRTMDAQGHSKFQAQVTNKSGNFSPHKYSTAARKQVTITLLYNTTFAPPY